MAAPRLVAPTHLRLLARAFANDSYAADGFHLRWLLGQRLGLPRAPVRVYFRPGVDRSFGALSGQVGRHFPDEPGYESGARRVWSECSAERDGGVPLDPQTQGLLLDGAPLHLELGGGGGQLSSQAVVELRVRLRGQGSVDVEAESWTSEGARVVAHAARGRGVLHVPEPAPFEPGVFEPAPFEPAVFGEPGVFGEPAVFEPHAFEPAPSVDEPVMFGEPAMFGEATLDPNFGVVEPTYTPVEPTIADDEDVVLHLSGPHIHRVRLTGVDAVLLSAAWIDTDSYLDAHDWELLDDRNVSLPIHDGPGGYYDAKVYDESEALMGAEQRVAEGRPNAEPPWTQPQIPPPHSGGLGPAHDQAVIQRASQLHARLRRVLEESARDGVPQRSIVESISHEPLRNVAGQATLSANPKAEIPLLATLLFASLDPDIARWLGLALTTRRLDLHASWDFKVEADYRAADLHDAALVQHVQGAGAQELTLAATIGAVRLDHGAMVPSPWGPHAEFVGRGAPGSGAAAQVELSWEQTFAHRADEITYLPAVYAVERRTSWGGGQTSLNPEDGAGNRRPLTAALEGGRHRFQDLRLPDEGDYIYGVSAGDLWGRWSPWAEAPMSWWDERVALPPGDVRADFLDPLDERAPADGLSWAESFAGQAVRVSFSWTDGHAAQSPSPDGFTLSARVGTVASGSDWRARGNWPSFERGDGSVGQVHLDIHSEALTTSGSLSARLAKREPVWRRDADGSLPPADQRVQIGERFHVDVAGLAFPQPSAARPEQRLTVGVATDASWRGRPANSDEVGGPAVARLSWRAAPEPPSLPGFRWSGRADATGWSTVQIEWDGEAGVQYSLWRCPAAAMLEAAADADQREAYEAGDDSVRAELLRELGPAAREVFERVGGPVPAEGSPSLASAGRRRVEDRLPGYATTATCYCLVGRSSAGVTGPWPQAKTHFVVVRVPRTHRPSTPSWGEAAVEGATVQLHFDLAGARFDAQGKAELDVPAAIEIYRIRDPDRARDLLRMRKVGTLSLAGHEARTASWADGALRSWRAYSYRAVAVGPADDRGAAPARSLASPALVVRTTDPAPPSAPSLSASAGPTPTATKLQWTAPVPAEETPEGWFRFALWRSEGAERWEQVELGIAARFEAAGPEPSMAGVAWPTRSFETIDHGDHGAPAGAEVRWRVRVIDPLGRYVDSPAVGRPGQ
ncbi:hypothetical protein PPSIR1_15875 [Plesiocystis pacifica SIR-1]|uniref:Uncharacterized protein n=1 Tax=Plesiocystis pacifica SIR-1 TaxID=391625 RepID=A6GJL3_9BACT|nr:hypothetical protein [Plesiocystis pacifica]EDM73946.1 hypothetical protein PPSIR1_15875 [Plesiocystis pacifica SIR-1]